MKKFKYSNYNYIVIKMKLYQRQDAIIYLEKELKKKLHEKENEELLKGAGTDDFYLEPMEEKIKKEYNTGFPFSYYIRNLNDYSLIGFVVFKIEFKKLPKVKAKNMNFNEIVKSVDIESFGIY